MTSTKTYKIFTWRLANKLNEKGFRPIGKTLNYKNPTQEVILFEDTPQFRIALSQALSELKK